MTSILFVDKTEGGFLGASWKTGATMFSKAFTFVKLVSSVQEVYDSLAQIPTKIDHAQVWGHGSAGEPLIAGVPLVATSDAWKKLNGGSLWFRSCYTMLGVAGQRFALKMTEHGVSVAGHLCIIGPWAMQSYLVGIKPGQRPWWSTALHPGPSTPWAPRTVSAVRMGLPQWAFKEEKLG